MWASHVAGLPLDEYDSGVLMRALAVHLVDRVMMCRGAISRLRAWHACPLIHPMDLMMIL